MAPVFPMAPLSVLLETRPVLGHAGFALHVPWFGPPGFLQPGVPGRVKQICRVNVLSMAQQTLMSLLIFP